MDSLIPAYHNTFIFDRPIQDNIMIAREVFHYLKTSQSRQHSMTVKINMYKAYDQVAYSC